MKAVQRTTFGVDKNLYGVSRQVTVSGVLAFAHVFAALRGGKGDQRQNRLNSSPAGVPLLRPISIQMR
jgi:hypothetical protein